MWYDLKVQFQDSKREMVLISASNDKGHDFLKWQFPNETVLGQDIIVRQSEAFDVSDSANSCGLIVASDLV